MHHAPYIGKVVPRLRALERLFFRLLKWTVPTLQWGDASQLNGKFQLQHQLHRTNMTAIRWGILGAGFISGEFVHDLVLNNRENPSGHQHIVQALGVSLEAKGEAFLKAHGVEEVSNHGVKTSVVSYDGLYSHPDVDIIYIGTPHTFHKEQAIAALNAGKHVLCEKPVTVNAAEARELVELAKKRNLFFMEAVWTRFFPAVQKLRKLLFEDQVLGDIYRLFADFSMLLGIDKVPSSSRGRDINLGAGALLDVGIYPITYGRILLDDKLGKDATEFETKSFLALDPVDKVDHETTVIIQYKNGRQGILTSGNLHEGPPSFVRLEAANGVVEMSSDNPARPKNFTITFRDPKKEKIVFEEKGDYKGFIHEANAVAEDLAQGRIESSVVPWDETLLVMDIMDKARRENGLVYPQDKK